MAHAAFQKGGGISSKWYLQCEEDLFLHKFVGLHTIPGGTIPSSPCITGWTFLLFFSRVNVFIVRGDGTILGACVRWKRESLCVFSPGFLAAWAEIDHKIDVQIRKINPEIFVLYSTRISNRLAVENNSKISFRDVCGSTRVRIWNF